MIINREQLRTPSTDLFVADSDSARRSILELTLYILSKINICMIQVDYCIIKSDVHTDDTQSAVVARV